MEEMELLIQSQRQSGAGDNYLVPVVWLRHFCEDNAQFFNIRKFKGIVPFVESSLCFGESLTPI